MRTPFDEAIKEIRRQGYHNHRLEMHSDIVSNGLIRDLEARCPVLRADLAAGTVRTWTNVASPGDRRRKVDLFVGEPDAQGDPDIGRLRIAVENKSVITAHRNRTNRFDDLTKVLESVHQARPEALIVATVLVGVARRYLNVPDKVHSFYRDREEEFEARVRPRLSSGDDALWEDFSWAVSHNSAHDAASTIDLMRTLPRRGAGQTHLVGYDFLCLVPVSIDNVNPPSLPRPNELGIDVDVEYGRMLDQLCRAYTARWHM
ncbi:MAG: hypothetical protein NW201_12710 [Gemmatimonadales bacterium]|nr:hypothetical protein [Gemmatimonadales bacterium]